MNTHTQLETVEFNASKKGKTLLFLGAVHGNEKCGTRAIRRIIAELRNEKIFLKKGKVIFVPVCNPKAYAKNARFIEFNLNRTIKRSSKPTSYETHLAQELCDIIDRADVLIDIHSITAKGQPFYYLDFPIKESRALGKILGPSIAILGWQNIYKKIKKGSGEFDTVSYAARNKKTGITLECGQHRDPKAVEIAYMAIKNTLKKYGMIAGSIKKHKVREITITKVYFRNPKERFCKEWQHLELVKKGEELFIDSKKRMAGAPFNGYVVMPNSKAFVGEDWLYLGVDKGERH